MKHLSAIFTGIVICLMSGLTYGQRNCGTDIMTKKIMKKIPELEGFYGRNFFQRDLQENLSNLPAVITIPVVFHILSNTADQDVSDAQINAQIAALNTDFACKNPDLLKVPAIFKDRVAADIGIRFVLREQPIHVHTDVHRFKLVPNDGNSRDFNRSEEPIKFHDLGGDNGFSSQQCLNIWVGDIYDGSPKQLLGYGTYPGHLGAFDGVVIYFKAIGPNANYPPFNKGRTLTHEIGHWLNLRHLWGDEDCGDDQVWDTPQQAGPNGGLPVFQHVSCGNDPNGDLFMDYMDTVDDAAMFMFSDGQRDRMRTNFVDNGDRSYFLHLSRFNAAGLLLNRKDLYTPVITNLKNKTLQASKRLVNKFLTWSAIDSARQYIVQTRLLGSQQYQRQQATTNRADLIGLKPGAIYEVTVITVDKNGQKSAPSVPYLFKVAPTPQAAPAKAKQTAIH